MRTYELAHVSFSFTIVAQRPIDGNESERRPPACYTRTFPRSTSGLLCRGQAWVVCAGRSPRISRPAFFFSLPCTEDNSKFPYMHGAEDNNRRQNMKAN